MDEGFELEEEGVVDCMEDCMRLRGFIWPSAPPKILDDDDDDDDAKASEKWC